MVVTDANRLCALKTTMCQVVSRFMDEHSMSCRALWAWLRHIHEELRRQRQVLDGAGNDLYLESDHGLYTVVSERPWGGIPFVISMGDCAQLPPVKMKALYDKAPGKPGSSDLIGKVALSEFMFPLNTMDSRCTIVIMDKVLRQDNPEFLTVHNNMTNGTMTVADSDFIASRCLDNMDPVERNTFKNAIHLVPTWQQTHVIVFKYLMEEFRAPIVKVTSIYGTTRVSGKNHCVKDSSYPKRSAFCVDAVVMLLKNFVVEWKIMNGAIGIICDIVFENSNGQREQHNTMPAYVVVEFPNCIIPNENSCFQNQPPNWVPIPVVTEPCEKRCCTITTIPLRVCNAITIHKCQGMSVGPGQQFEKLLFIYQKVHKIRHQV